MDNEYFQPRRSFIFMPGVSPDMFPKALATGADIVCIDLEDAIAPNHKQDARERTMKLFEAPQAKKNVRGIPRIFFARQRENCFRGIFKVFSRVSAKNKWTTFTLGWVMGSAVIS